MTNSKRTLICAITVLIGVGFATQLSDNSSPTAPADAQRIEPEFHITRFRDELRLAGHTLSVAQERTLLNAAAERFPDLRVSSDFEPLGLVPPHWETTLLEVLIALSAASSGAATVNQQQVIFKVVTTDDSWPSRLAALRARFAGSLEVVDDSVVVADSALDDLCAGAYADYTLGPVMFVESTAELRPSAIPELEQLAALADACREATVQVTGHTDTTGDESWNQVLSLRRAQAVTGYLLDKGIAAERLDAVGAGSAKPIASNETRYGRSLNCRIEVNFIVR